MLYLLDASILITAHNSYYPIDRVPEFWEWLLHQGITGKVKIPQEILEEVLEGRAEGDSLLGWLNDCDTKQALSLADEVDPALVQRVVYDGYASDLTDIEVMHIGRDPFLIAHALAEPERCVVTVETSSPKKQRQNRKIPDVCKTFTVNCCGPFDLNRALGFRTTWKSGTQ